ncbi:hypothetical protein Terro_2972 [Terriglobus roseus DSM 18391]|uniref:Uncharacterized protein n=1 Tax=Terriglobus roseus (strain DSM 18391 / NRRL B-41598 / KBS 63) TaxID=926566 RepID=I3ZIY6_TERRK|nr:hypothetical protein [Terriglobus roseus]AFL89204.1 hypothetical protein Terro_2972 [Terriglobus roseus DSM 18391]
MPGVNDIINDLTSISGAQYVKVNAGPPSSRKTGHQLAFEALQGQAGQVAAILRQNPVPNRDQKENINAQFLAMKKNVGLYCVKTDNTRDVLKAFNNAETEWQVLSGQ